MKKYLMIAFVVILLALLVIWVIPSADANKSIPLVDGLRFGMTPQQAEKVLGESCEVEQDIGGSGKNAYTYKTVVLGHEAVVTCYFLNDRQLTQVDFSWDINTAELYDRAYACILEQYRGDKNFFEKETGQPSPESKCVSLGVDDSVTGLFYHLYAFDTSLLITCVDNS